MNAISVVIGLALVVLAWRWLRPRSGTFIPLPFLSCGGIEGAEDGPPGRIRFHNEAAGQAILLEPEAGMLTVLDLGRKSADRIQRTQVARAELVERLERTELEEMHFTEIRLPFPRSGWRETTHWSGILQVVIALQGSSTPRVVVEFIHPSELVANGEYERRRSLAEQLTRWLES
jgi:hypothetical protein